MQRRRHSWSPSSLSKLRQCRSKRRSRRNAQTSAVRAYRGSGEEARQHPLDQTAAKKLTLTDVFARLLEVIGSSDRKTATQKDLTYRRASKLARMVDKFQRIHLPSEIWAKILQLLVDPLDMKASLRRVVPFFKLPVVRASRETRVAYEKALELDPNNQLVRNSLASLLTLQDQKPR